MLDSLKRWLRRHTPGAPPLPDAVWQTTLVRYPFLAALPPADRARLRSLVQQFIGQKEFHGANGLVITDQIAVDIAAQACLPVLHLPTGLAWYDDFVGIVVHPGEVVARREYQDPAGVVHRYSEVISGEAMHRGPVMLSWQDVAVAGDSAQQGYNVVVHEFVHKLDMRDGEVDGCPPLPHGFMGHPAAAIARTAWLGAMHAAHDRFREQVTIAERFGGDLPWLNDYGAVSVVEFFAVACEAYFVNRPRFAADFADLLPLLDAFFRPGGPPPATA